MAKQYATSKQFAERSGLGVRIVDETVGTGAGTSTAQQSFDLDNDNIITGTYILSHAPSGSNDFTQLTETTHYTLDGESGRILTTGSGAEELGTDNLYASYTYIESFSGSVVSDLLDNATAQVDKLTGKNWGSGTVAVEYRDGRRTLGYPTTDRPYTTDWDQPDWIVLNNYPVTRIDGAYFLSSPVEISKYFQYDSSETSFDDKTTEANSSTESAFNMFATSPGTGDICYIGSTNRFLGLHINFATPGTDAGTNTLAWEYSSGTSTWSGFTPTQYSSGVRDLFASGRLSWNMLTGWEKAEVNDQTLYWVRIRLTTADWDEDPELGTLSIKDSVSTVVEPRNVSFKQNGILNFMGVSVPDGQQNVRIDYYYGLETTPEYIKELAILVASIQAYVNLSGGSYDDATSYTIGSKSVTIGEAYVNIREVLDQFKKRVKEILDMIGKRADVRAI